MKFASLLALVASLASPLVWGEDYHFIAPDSWSQQSLSPQGLEQRIQSAAVTYQHHGEIARVAFFDIAFPADAAEYHALDGYGVLLVAALSRSGEELPPKRVYVRLPHATIELKLLASARSASRTGSLIEKVFGPHRWEGLYLFPVYTRRSNAELALDFALNRTGFILARFEASGTEALAELPVQPPTSQSAAEEPLLMLVAREFPGFVSLFPSKK